VSAPLTLTVLGHSIVVNRHAIAETGTGLAGYLEAVLPDGRVVVAVGRWDDPSLVGHADEGADVWCEERVWVDGEMRGVIPGLELQGGAEVEHIARAIWEATKPQPIEAPKLDVAQIAALRLCALRLWPDPVRCEFFLSIGHRRRLGDAAMTLGDLVTPGFDLTPKGRAVLAAIDAEQAS
jgi:hypothetical protein